MAFFVALEVLLLGCILYAIYKYIWFFFKMTALQRKINRLNGKYNVTISWQRPFFHRLFGEKGPVDVVITTSRERFAISTLSFASVHSRWNLEQTKGNTYVEVRRKHFVFYRVENHSENHSEYAMQYDREYRFKRCQLKLPQDIQENTASILLIYPAPCDLTISDFNTRPVTSKERLGKHEILYWDDLISRFS